MMWWKLWRMLWEDSPKNPQVMNSARALEIPLEETEMVVMGRECGQNISGICLSLSAREVR